MCEGRDVGGDPSSRLQYVEQGELLLNLASAVPRALVVPAPPRRTDLGSGRDEECGAAVPAIVEPPLSLSHAWMVLTVSGAYARDIAICLLHRLHRRIILHRRHLLQSRSREEIDSGAWIERIRDAQSSQGASAHRLALLRPTI